MELLPILLTLVFVEGSVCTLSDLIPERLYFCRGLLFLAVDVGNLVGQLVDCQLILCYDLLLPLFISNFQLVLLPVQMEPLILPLLIQFCLTRKNQIPFATITLEQALFVFRQPVVVTLHLPNDIVQLLILLPHPFVVESVLCLPIPDVLILLPQFL